MNPPADPRRMLPAVRAQRALLLMICCCLILMSGIENWIIWGITSRRAMVILLRNSNTVVNAQQQQVLSKAPSTRTTSGPTACRPRKQQQRYAISSAGIDGVGHQMEAKLSCLATAAAMGMTYIHQPIQDLQHETDPHAMEALFGLSRLVASTVSSTVLSGNDEMLPRMRVFNETTMQRVRRKPLPWVGHCDEASWFDDKLTPVVHDDYCGGDDENDDSTTTLPVYTHDNCWDYFWCHVDEAAHAWNLIRLTVRQHFLQPLLFNEQQRKQSDDNLLTVALHVRQGDAGARSMDPQWCKRVLQQIANAVANSDRRPNGIHVRVHSDASQSFIEESIRRDDNDKDSAALIQFSIYGRDHPDATIERAMYEMVTSDILVASDSSLSHAAALLRHPHQPVVHPNSKDRSRMGRLGWYMIDKHLQLCAEAPIATAGRECAAWTATNETFWTTMVATAIQSRPQYL